jgi:hypothetical protein
MEIIINIIATIFLIVGLYLFFVPAKKQSCCKNSKCDCSELKIGNRGSVAEDDCQEELK